MPPRRVALVIGQLHLGGAERQLYELAARLDRSRHDPLVVCLSELTAPYAERLARLGIPVETLPRAGNREWGRARALARLLARHRVDLSHAFLLAANAYVYAAQMIESGAGLVRRRRPFIASSRVSSPPVGWLPALVHRRAFRAAAAVIANSRKVIEHTSRLYGVPQERFHLIHNGVALEEFPVSPSQQESQRREQTRRVLGAVDDTSVLVGTMGRLAPQKNLDLFLDLAARLSAHPVLGQRTRFAIVGEGPARDELEAGARRRGLTGRLVFAGAREDVATVLSAFDLFVLTSDYEGLPNVILEAMAAFRPVVATRADGAEELVTHGVTGYLAQRGDVEGLARGVETLAGDPNARREMGLKARARIESDFTVERMVALTTALYDQVLG
ncbi:MAG TPA: glycosyltransferase [Candidatus Polarisedimenticolia bacterium]|nr:glycosyltransferase [Candidatus Polarisedimenticolia bacterium]